VQVSSPSVHFGSSKLFRTRASASNGATLMVGFFGLSTVFNFAVETHQFNSEAGLGSLSIPAAIKSAS